MTVHYTTNHLLHRATGASSYTTLLRVANGRKRALSKFTPEPITADGGSGTTAPADR